MSILTDRGGNTKPRPLPVVGSEIPRSLTERKQWVLWQYTERGGKWTKPPYQLNGGLAKSNDSSTWAWFDEVLERYQEGSHAGIGFCFAKGDGLAGVDLDHVWDSETGTITNIDAKRILQKFAQKAYIEFSPGGDGFRIFGKGIHGRCGKAKGAQNWIECYDHNSNRYLTVTGQEIKGFSADEPQDCQEEFDWLFKRYMKKDEEPKATSPDAQPTADEWPDDYVIERAKISSKGAWFASAYDVGEVYNSKTGELVTDRSSADLILCNSLAFWTGRNATQMDRLFRKSALMRDKWDEVHYSDGTTHGEATVKKAIDGCKNTIHELNAERSSDDWVAELNAIYSPVRYLTKMAVAFIAFDETTRRDVWTFVSFATFSQMYCSEYAPVGTDKKGNPIMKEKGYWLRHPDRVKNREFYFNPAMPPKLEREGYLNLWVGFAVKGPSTGGDPEPMLAHIRDVVCQGDEDKIRYVMGWIATLIKEPGRRHEVALVLRGKKGSGKGTLGNLLCRIFGRHGLALSVSRHLTGNFNDHLLDCCFLFADEAFFAGDRSTEGSLKARITEPFLAIEPKGLPIFTAVNRLSILMATNNDYVVPASADERRYAVFDVADSRIGDRDYFRQLNAWAQEDRNVVAFIEYMQAYDLKDYEVRDVLETRELAEQREHSLPPWAQWWKDALARGFFGGDRWFPVVPNQFLHSSYGAYNAFRRFQKHDILGEACLGKEVTRHKLTRGAIRPSASLADPIPMGLMGNWTDSSPILAKEGARPPCRVLGALEEARKAFVSAFGLPQDLFKGCDDPTGGGE